MIEWIKKQPFSNFSRILEPSCGDGVFIDSLIENIDFNQNYHIDAVEVNQVVADSLEVKFQGFGNIHIENKDFLDFQCFNNSKYNLIIGNPPYIKRTLLSEKQVILSKQIFESFQTLTNSNLKNIWSSFLVRSISLLDENGVLAFVLPAELLQVDYAAQLRQLLIKEFSRIEVFTFNELLFKECKGQDTIILIAYKKANIAGLFFSNIENTNDLVSLENIKFTKHSIDEKKWSSHSLTLVELNLINRLLQDCLTIGDLSLSKPGIVTAANEFFILNQENVDKYHLEEYKRPIVQKGSLLRDRITFDNKDFEDLHLSNTPCYFIDMNTQSSLEDQNILPYLKIGLEQKLNERYKMQTRMHWFQVPYNAEPTPLFFFKRGHNYPKLVRNYSNAITTDSAYLVTPHKNYDADSILFSFYNSFTLACAELFGRYYGGGVLEVTPNEFKRLPLPYTSISQKEFKQYLKFHKEKNNIYEIVEKYNTKILKSFFQDITDEEITTLENIRLKLVNRRQRL